MARPPSSPPLVALRGIRLADGPRPLFEGVDLALHPRRRACLVGRNGAGKSTLMKMVMGVIEPDAGERTVQTGTRFAYVPQEPVIVGETLLDHATAGGAPAWVAESKLRAFGLDPARSSRNLSGGETRRAALARALAEDPEVLLLDEPTNHLDILAIETLEAELAATRAALLVVSHDRAFLERITDACFWLEGRRVRVLDRGFAHFDAFADQAMAEEAEQLRRLGKEIELETHAFHRSITGRRTRNEGRARRLRELRAEQSERLRDRSRDLNLGLDSGGISGRLVAELKGVTKGWPGRVILKPFSTRILRGDRVAIVGPNGAGKTTLVKIMLGELAPDAGEVRLGTGLAPVYLDQARAELTADMTLKDALAPDGDSVMVRGQPKHVAAYARDFLFTDAQLRQPVSSLSGGERNRLLLARALAKPANLLILDEPTNDLDMETLDRLEELLEGYDGTLILVSHDRDFINRLATSTIALNGCGDAVETPGGWTDFIEQNPGFFSGEWRVASGESKKGASAPASTSPAPTRHSPPATPRKLSYKDARRLEEAERQMAELPATIATHEEKLADPGLYARDPAAFARVNGALEEARAALEAAETDWLMIEEKKAALEG